MNICQACNHKNYNNDVKCAHCGKPLLRSNNKLEKNCEECGLSRSKEINIGGQERHLCYECYTKATHKYFYSSEDTYKLQSKAEAVYFYFTSLRNEALYYGDDVAVYEYKMQIAADMMHGLNPQNWSEITNI